MGYKCKKCKEELTYLGYTQEVQTFGRADLDKNKEYIKYEVSTHESDDGGEYYCPYCSNTITASMEEALEILKKMEGD